MFVIFFFLFLIFRAIFDALEISHSTLAIVLIVVVFPMSLALSGLYCRYVAPELVRDAANAEKTTNANRHPNTIKARGTDELGDKR